MLAAFCSMIIPYLQIFSLMELRGRGSRSGETFTIKEVRVHRRTRQIGFIDTEGKFHGLYVPEEYLGSGNHSGHKAMKEDRVHARHSCLWNGDRCAPP
jgi:hypothetical protein